jgi:hypothetical protein
VLDLIADLGIDEETLILFNADIPQSLALLREAFSA